jgi:hypothetical protein
MVASLVGVGRSIGSVGPTLDGAGGGPMLEGAGFTIIDLGVNVPPERFVDRIGEHNPDIAGYSAYLTTTAPMLKANNAETVPA